MQLKRTCTDLCTELAMQCQSYACHGRRPALRIFRCAFGYRLLLRANLNVYGCTAMMLDVSHRDQATQSQ